MSFDIPSIFIKAFWCYLFLEKGNKNNNQTSHPAVDDTDTAPIKLLKAAIIERRADFLHKRVVKIQIMHNAQPHTEHLAAFKQMMHISARKSAAGGAIAPDFKRRIIGFILRVVQIHNTVHRKNLAVTGVSGRHNAVENINAAAHTLDNIHRSAHAH